MTRHRTVFARHQELLALLLVSQQPLLYALHPYVGRLGHQAEGGDALGAVENLKGRTRRSRARSDRAGGSEGLIVTLAASSTVSLDHHKMVFSAVAKDLGEDEQHGDNDSELGLTLPVRSG